MCHSPQVLKSHKLSSLCRGHVRRRALAQDAGPCAAVAFRQRGLHPVGGAEMPTTGSCPKRVESFGYAAGSAGLRRWSTPWHVAEGSPSAVIAAPDHLAPRGMKPSVRPRERHVTWAYPQWIYMHPGRGGSFFGMPGSSWRRTGWSLAVLLLCALVGWGYTIYSTIKL